MNLTSVLDCVYNVGEISVEELNPNHLREWAKYYELKSKLGNFHNVVVYCLEYQLVDTGSSFLSEYLDDYYYQLNNREEVA